MSLAAYQFHHRCFTLLAFTGTSWQRKKSFILLSKRPTNTHRLSSSCLFLSQGCHDSATLPSLTAWGAGTRNSANRGAWFIFTAVCMKCPRFGASVLFFSPCAKVFLQWRNLGGIVIFVSPKEIQFFGGVGSKKDEGCTGENCNTMSLCCKPPASEQTCWFPPMETC